MSLPLAAEDIQVQNLLDLNTETSNKILGAEDEHTMQEMLTGERRSLTELDQKIDRLECILGGLRKQRESCIARMNRYSVALSPQKRLPPEILAKVFVHSLPNQPTVLPPSATEPPWAFRWVCSRWRHVTLGEHRLWSQLVVKDSRLFSTESMVTTWMSKLWGQTHTFPVSLTMISSAKEIVLRDTLSPYLQRLQSLSLNIPTKPLSAFLISPPTSFDRLDSLTLDFSQGMPHVANPPPDVFTTLVSLKRVTLEDCYFVSIETNHIPRLPWS